MGEEDRGEANGPSAKPDTIALSNGIRLSGRQWLGLGLFAALILAFAPSLWNRAEKFALEPDYRMPHDLSSDYWLYDASPDWPPIITTPCSSAIRSSGGN